MADMFYSLSEAAGKLGKTEGEVKELVKAGRLREYRDGPNLLFKISEVESLMSDTSIMQAKEPFGPVDENDVVDEILLAPEPTEEAPTPTGFDDADTIIAGEEVSDSMAGGSGLGADIDEAAALSDATSLAESTEGDTRSIQDEALSEEGKGGAAGSGLDEAMLEEDAGAASGSGLDEALSASSSSEASLEEIEEDVNLDTFGSGSGLLDLSLQADDTSLGGILDEIYTPEGEGQEGGEAAVMEESAAAPAEADEILAPEEEFAAPRPSFEVPTARPAYAEPEPDMLSNALGYMLILPIVAVIYTAIVAAAGSKGVLPEILKSLQGMIWFIVLGLLVVSGGIVGGAYMLSQEKTPKPPKARKEKKKKKKKGKGAESEEPTV